MKYTPAKPHTLENQRKFKILSTYVTSVNPKKMTNSELMEIQYTTIIDNSMGKCYVCGKEAVAIFEMSCMCNTCYAIVSNYIEHLKSKMDAVEELI